MDRLGYYDDAHVRDFRLWVAPFVKGECSLGHQWQSPKWGRLPWSCETVEEAYRTFKWSFSVTVPGDSQPTRGQDFEENAQTLDRLRVCIRESVETEDRESFVQTALAIFQWGGVGVRANGNRLYRLGDNIMPTILGAAEQLGPSRAHLSRLEKVSAMNSGFSKIYSLLLNGFPICDSRVACALASLVQLYCNKKQLNVVPSSLVFGIPPHNAKASRYVSTFPKLRGDSDTQIRLYAISNIKAAWLLGAMAEDSQFAGLAGERGLLALQSAMFMIGFRPLDSKPTMTIV